MTLLHLTLIGAVGQYGRLS